MENLERISIINSFDIFLEIFIFSIKLSKIAKRNNIFEKRGDLVSMYPNLDGASSNYEDTLNKLSNHIKELFSQIQLYQAIISEKEHQINQLINENNHLKMQIQNLSNQLNPRYKPNLKSFTPPVPTQQPIDSSILREDPRIMKRQCPNCGASGFAIREVEDKTKIISYVPRRIYAKKMVCTKCRFEF